MGAKHPEEGQLIEPACPLPSSQPRHHIQALSPGHRLEEERWLKDMEKPARGQAMNLETLRISGPVWAVGGGGGAQKSRGPGEGEGGLCLLFCPEASLLSFQSW
jgi:hypothetical protein